MKKPVKVKKADPVGQLWGAVKNLEKRVDEVVSATSSALHVAHNACNDVANVRRVITAKEWGEARQLTPDAHSVYVQPEKPFCVIANTARYISGGAQGRSWYATQKQAEDHAGSIVRNHPNQYEELYVVEIKSKVSKQRPELEVTRY